MKATVELLEELWEQGNCAGLDGWIGLGRGVREFDEEAVHIRRRDVAKVLDALAVVQAAEYAKLTAEVAYQKARAAYFKYVPEIEHDPEGVQALVVEMRAAREAFFALTKEPPASDKLMEIMSEIVQERVETTARDLLGICPGFTGGLSVDEYMNEQRGRGQE